MARQPVAYEANEAVRQRFLAAAITILLAITLFVAIGPALAPMVEFPWNPLIGLATGLAALPYGVAYWHNREGRTLSASRWLVAGVLIGSLAPILIPGGIGEIRSFAFISFNILIAAFVLSWRAGAVLAGADVLALLGLAAARPQYAAGPFTEDLVLVGIFAALSLTFAAFSEYNWRANRASQEALALTVSDLKAMLDNGPDAMLNIRADGEILRLNGVAKDWVQSHFHRDAVPGDLVPDIIGPAAWAQVAPLAGEAMRSGGVSSEMTFHGRRGPVWLQIHLRHIEGTDDCFAAQIRNATQGRQIELRERAAYRDRIELEKLRDIDRFRTRLLNTASHEMRTPMTPLRLQLGVLERRLGSAMDERAQHSFATIKRNIGRLTMLLDDLLDVSKLEANELHLKPVSVDVDKMVTSECEVYRAMAKARGLRLTVQSHVHAEVRADPHRLAQVFSNLLSNAIKYARSEVTVTSSRQDGEVFVEVHDDGTGFNPARADGLWEPFMQIQDGDRQREGTGLGLYICKGIIEHHGGRIWATSEGIGKGARFTFALPLHASLKYEGAPMVVHE